MKKNKKSTPRNKDIEAYLQAKNLLIDRAVGFVPFNQINELNAEVFYQLAEERFTSLQ